MSKVRITTGEHTVEVEHDSAKPSELSKLAHALWKKTRDPADKPRVAIGFAVTERS